VAGVEEEGWSVELEFLSHGTSYCQWPWTTL
jgi:hypothetical protein